MEEKEMKMSFRTYQIHNSGKKFNMKRNAGSKRKKNLHDKKKI